jgi:hypothetical protein
MTVNWEDRPSPSDLADEYPIREPLVGQARAEADARLGALLALPHPEGCICGRCQKD